MIDADPRMVKHLLEIDGLRFLAHRLVGQKPTMGNLSSVELAALLELVREKIKKGVDSTPGCGKI